MYLGSSRGLERSLVVAPDVRRFLIPMAPPTSPRGVALLALATLRSLLLIARTRPSVTFATGGYVSVPAGLASWLLRVPLVLFLPDVVPGKAVRWLVPLARRISVSTEDALTHLPPERTVVTGYPVREEFEGATRPAGRKRFDLPSDADVLCVFGGSQGARTINQALAACLPHLLSRCHVIHVCGQARLQEAEEAAASLSPEKRSRYRLFPYLEGRDMALALAASDLAVCRSGASVLGELPAAGAPAILVPLPAVAVHQGENAEYLVRRGAATVIDNETLGERLGPTIDGLLNDRPTLGRMAAAARSLFRPDAGAEIAAIVREAAA
jgi:UDP-N-acetylglucosamine--N-acetylmuramyl-(pentapeptide) pyrophosphoryl-undecaprenol N-acetylglucosamine transferase